GFFAVVFLAAGFFAVGFLAEVFLAAGFDAVDFFAPDAAFCSLAAGFAGARFFALVLGALDFGALDFGPADLPGRSFTVVDRPSAGAASSRPREGGGVVSVRLLTAGAVFAAGRPGQAGRWPTASSTGICAACGCSAPATTWSFLICCRPRRFFGSIPRTAFSTAATGRVARRSA